MTEEVKNGPIKIGDKYYAADSLTQTGIALLQDVSLIEQEMKQYTLKISIHQLAKAKLIDELAKEMDKFVEVPAPEETGA